MVDRLHLPLSYGSAARQAKRDADAIASLNVLAKLNQLTEERLHKQQQLEIAMVRQQEEQLLVARRFDPISIGSYLLGRSSSQEGSLFAQQHSPRMRSQIPPENLVPKADFDLSPLLSSHGSSDRLDDLLSPRTRARSLSEKEVFLASASLSISAVPERKGLSFSDTAREEHRRRTPSATSAEKVQAALRSRPQRGKKRINLSKEERGELIKTRNREHARNTRMRKKARQMELEQREKELESFLESKQLEKERIACLKQFLASRQNMLNTSAVVVEGDDSGDEIGTRLLSDVVVDPLDSFVFETRGIASISDGKKTSPITEMRQWDQRLRRKIFESNEILPSTFFAYEVQDGVDGIAMSKNGSTYAQIDLVLHHVQEDNRSSTPTLTKEPMINMNKLKGQGVVLLKILMKAQFGVENNSSKLASMEWIILEDSCGLEEQ